MKFQGMVVAMLVATAAPCMAAGWVDSEVRQSATPASPSNVAKMATSDGSVSKPMGVVNYRAPTARELAAQVAAFEGGKERHRAAVVLDDRVWDAPRSRTQVEIGRPLPRPKASDLVHEIVPVHHHHHGNEHDFYADHHHAAHGEHHLVEIDVDHTEGPDQEFWWLGDSR